MSDQQPSTNPEPMQQDARSAAPGPVEPIRNWYGAPVSARRLDRGQRRVMITIGGVLAGVGFGTGLALVIRAIAQANPAAFPNGVSDQVVLILLVVAPLIGLGLGLMTGALIPDEAARRAEPPTSAQ